MSTFPLDPNLPAAPATIHPSIRERVERGVAWLNDVKPDWRTFIDVTTLDIADAEHCVLGQVFDSEAVENDHNNGYDYVYNVHVPVESRSWMTRHGFDSAAFTPAAYDKLAAAWHRFLDGEW